MAHTVIQVPVPGLELLVRRHVVADNPGISIRGDTTVCAHVTLLGPFVDRRDVDAALLTTLRELLAPVPGFTFELRRVDRFPDGLVYLPPDPSGPFERLTETLAAAFPDWPPYRAAFDDVVPHLSIGANLPQAELDSLAERLPIVATAEEVTLTWWSPDTIATMAAFPLVPLDAPDRVDTT